MIRIIDFFPYWRSVNWRLLLKSVKKSVRVDLVSKLAKSQQLILKKKKSKKPNSCIVGVTGSLKILPTYLIIIYIFFLQRLLKEISALRKIWKNSGDRQDSGSRLYTKFKHSTLYFVVSCYLPIVLRRSYSCRSALSFFYSAIFVYGGKTRRRRVCGETSCGI